MLGLRLTGGWRLWAPLFAIGAGAFVAIPFGLYDFQRVLDAPWVGIPGTWFPDFETPEVDAFFALLPMVVIVVLINGVKNMGDSVVVQRNSRREPRATDYRLVQGSLYANATGVLFSGIAGSPPNHHQLRHRRRPCQPHRRCQSQRRLHRRRNAGRLGLLPQADRDPARHSCPGNGGLSAGRDGDLRGGGNPNRWAGRIGPQEGP